MSYCRFASAGDKKSLMSLKAILEQRLACVDKRLQQNGAMSPPTSRYSRSRARSPSRS
jgi:hypothetical protein